MPSLTTQQLIGVALWAAPAVQTLATFAFVWACYALRRNLGAHTVHTGAMMAFVVIMLALHAGYFLAPLWWKSGRYLLGAATMLPVAIIVLGTLVVVASQTQLVHDLARQGTAIRLGVLGCVGVLVLAYIVPLGVMIAGW